MICLNFFFKDTTTTAIYTLSLRDALPILPKVLIVKDARPIRTVQDLVAFIRANPREANFSSASPGTSSHLSGLLFAQRMGVEVTHVPYRGTAPSMQAVLKDRKSVV